MSSTSPLKQLYVKHDEPNRKKLRNWEEVVGVVVYWLLNMLVYLRDGSVQTILRAATLR